MEKNNRKFPRATLSLMLVMGLILPSSGWLAPVHVKAANENNPPSKIDLTGIFIPPTTGGSNSSVIGGNIVQITPNSPNQKGGIWSTEANKMDLTKDFNASMYIYFGNQGANAADGMAFVMHNDSRGTNALSPHSGSGLGVYAGQKHGSSKTDGIQKSFAVEFDTYINNNGFDGYFDTNTTKGTHVAWSYPGLAETYIDYFTLFEYRRTMKHNNIDGPSSSVQYPGNLSNDTWRKFTINWNATTSTLTYQLEGLDPVSVPINIQNIFGADQVYWGFTGSTGSRYQNNRVAFDEVPGLVNTEVKETITRKDGTVVDGGALAKKGEELTYTINAKYLSGKQDWTNIIVKTVLNDHVSYVPGSMTISAGDGSEELDDSFWTGQSLAASIPNMNTNRNDVTISFKAKVNQVKVNTQVTESVKFEGSNYITNTKPVDYVIQANNAPEVTINEEGPIHLAVGEDYQVKGTWMDSDDYTNTLSYDLDGELLKSEVLDNGGSTEPVDWSYPITSDQLKLGENNFHVIARDNGGAYSDATIKIIVESPPAISLTDANREFPVDFGTEYTISGSWNDLDSNLVDLYYAVDSNTPVKFASNVSNSTNKGEDIDYQHSIPADQLSLGMHQVAVYVVDDTGRKSNIEVVTVNVTGKLSFMSVTENVSFENMQIPNQPTYSKRNNDWDILVKDTRRVGSSWRLTATLTGEFSDSQGHLLRDALKFVNEDGIETTMALGVETNVYEMITQDEQNVSINWESDKGILLKIDPFVYIGDYTGKINWHLIDAP
ncbi:L-type lectin-domain containing protein [Peribacillus sp. NPDC096622]|uniref:L-type lectin-domain containing protein n=1 Tax=Peribacillus sp. NPDC096622 TaxID=3364396 RepID=UPI003807A29A